MRIVTWNCKGAFKKKQDLIVELRPDILVVPECERMLEFSQTFDAPRLQSFNWFGSNHRKGLGVFCYGNFNIKTHPSYDARHQWIVPLVVTGASNFVLFAVWTLPNPESGSYVQPLIESFKHYQSLMQDTAVVWAGDFNSNVVFDRPLREFKFCDFVRLLNERDIQSVYHGHRGCDHGKEPDKTFYLYHHVEKGFHIDFIFASRSLYPHGIDVSVGSHQQWTRKSDHMPLICEFYESPTDRSCL